MSIVGKWFGFSQDEIYEEGTQAFERGDFDEAIAAFEACLDDEAADPAMARLAKHYLCESYAAAGQRALRSGDYGDALESLTHAVRLSPNYPDLHLLLARANRGLGNRIAEAECLDRALELHGQYVDAMLIRAERFYEEGNPDKGLKLLEEAALADHRLYGDAYRALKEAHGKQDFDSALDALRKISPEQAQAATTHAQLGENYIRAKEYAKAAKEFEQAIQFAPNYADIRCKYGKVLLELERPEEAAEHFRKAIEINDRYVDAHAHLGIALARIGKEIEAGDSFQHALVLDPYHPVAVAEAGKMPARRSMR